MKATLFATFVALLMVGCGEQAQKKVVVQKWDEWEADPEPYGGPEVLAKINEAKASGATKLQLGSNEITDVSPLEGLTNLERLNLGYNQITDISSLKGLTKLEKLGLWDNEITDVSPLAGLTNLEELALHGNQITDVSPLAGLTKLHTLILWDNPIPEDQKSMLKKALPKCDISFEL